MVPMPSIRLVAVALKHHVSPPGHPATRPKFEIGFHEGWGAALDQMVAVARRLQAG